jgi:hypothetical protein
MADGGSEKGEGDEESLASLEAASCFSSLEVLERNPASDLSSFLTATNFCSSSLYSM